MFKKLLVAAVALVALAGCVSQKFVTSDVTRYHALTEAPQGKTFAIVKDGERRVLTREIDDEQVPVASLTMTVVRANAKARVFYGKAYVEGDSDGAKPMCFSHDGAAPSARS